MFPHTESQKELNLKFRKVNPSSYMGKENQITDKITNKHYTKKFQPSYKELKARDRYLNDVLTNKSVHIPSTKMIEKDDIFSSLGEQTKPKISNKKRPKSIYLTRSYTSSNLLEHTTMNSKIRSILNNESDIFFTNKKTIPIDEKEITKRKKDKTKEMKTFSELIKKAKIPRSRYSTNCDWKYTNTEERSKSVNPRLRVTYGRKDILTKGDDIGKERISNGILKNANPPKEAKEKVMRSFPKTNEGSVNYNIISKEDNNKHKKLYSSASAKNLDIDHYEISVKKGYDKLSSLRIRNMFISQGIHVFGLEESGETVVGLNKGKFTFNVRKGIDQRNYKEKIEQIKDKLKKNNMNLVQLDKRRIIKTK